MDIEVRNKIVEENINLIYPICNKFRYRSDIEDIQQVAKLGLIKAVGTHDSVKGALSTYAYAYIKGYVYRYLDYNKLDDTVSLDTPISSGTENLSLMDTLEDVNAIDPLAMVANEEVISLIENTLELEQQEVIKLLYFYNASIVQVAKYKNIEVNKVKSIKDKSLRKLRHTRYAQSLKPLYISYYHSPSYENTGKNYTVSDPTANIALKLVRFDEFIKRYDDFIKSIG